MFDINSLTIDRIPKMIYDLKWRIVYINQEPVLIILIVQGPVHVEKNKNE